jgi:O-acetyl-ADP-ribose deacetylase (regulator of RNase III)
MPDAHSCRALCYDGIHFEDDTVLITMIEYVRGDILEDDADFIVIPVNSVGKPGIGLAKQWAEQAPERVVEWYKNRCAAGDVEPGHIYHFEDSSFLLATTKDHWLRNSDLEWIDSIVEDLVYLVIHHKWFAVLSEDGQYYVPTKTIALPKLGCGWGGLKWKDVKELIESRLEQSPALFRIYL